MKIETKTSADIISITIKRNKAHDGKEAYLDVEIGVKEEEAASFGEDFGNLAFSSMRETTNEDGVTKLIHLQDSIKPSARVVYPRHVITIGKSKIKEQPELLVIKTVDGEAKVVAKYRMPIATTQTDLLSALMDKVGGTVTMSFTPEQLSMPGGQQELPKK